MYIFSANLILNNNLLQEKLKVSLKTGPTKKKYCTQITLFTVVFNGVQSVFFK